MECKTVRYNIENNVAYITIDNAAQGNSLTEETELGIHACLEDAHFNPEVKVIVLQGEGRMFSGGGSIDMLLDWTNDLDANENRIEAGLVQPGNNAILIRKILKPVIVSIQGAAAGAASSIALAADFRIMAENAFFIEAFVNIGLSTDGGAAYWLTKLLGASKTTEMIMLGQRFSAEELQRLNLVAKVVPVEDLREETKKFAEKLAQGPSKAYKFMKELINSATYYDMESALAKEAEYQNVCIHSKDCAEGLKSFKEKRAPKFTGR